MLLAYDRLLCFRCYAKTKQSLTFDLEQRLWKVKPTGTDHGVDGFGLNDINISSSWLIISDLNLFKMLSLQDSFRYEFEPAYKFLSFFHDSLWSLRVIHMTRFAHVYIFYTCKFAWCANSCHVNANTHLSKFALRVILYQVWRLCKSIFAHVQICMHVISVMWMHSNLQIYTQKIGQDRGQRSGSQGFPFSIGVHNLKKFYTK